jgi:hypothetical protein
MISLFPQMCIDVEVTSGTSRSKKDGHTLREKRIHVLTQTLVKEGIDPKRVKKTVKTIIHGPSQTFSPEDTVNLRVSYDANKPCQCPPIGHHPGNQYLYPPPEGALL